MKIKFKCYVTINGRRIGTKNISEGEFISIVKSGACMNEEFKADADSAFDNMRDWIINNIIPATIKPSLFDGVIMSEDKVELFAIANINHVKYRIRMLSNGATRDGRVMDHVGKQAVEILEARHNVEIDTAIRLKDIETLDMNRNTAGGNREYIFIDMGKKDIGLILAHNKLLVRRYCPITERINTKIILRNSINYYDNAKLDRYGVRLGSTDTSNLSDEHFELIMSHIAHVTTYSYDLPPHEMNFIKIHGFTLQLGVNLALDEDYVFVILDADYVNVGDSCHTIIKYLDGTIDCELSPKIKTISGGDDIASIAIDKV